MFTWGQSCQQQQQQLRTHDGGDESVRKKPVKPGTSRRVKQTCIKSRPSVLLYNCTQLHSSDSFSYLLLFRLPSPSSCPGYYRPTCRILLRYWYLIMTLMSSFSNEFKKCDSDLNVYYHYYYGQSLRKTWSNKKQTRLFIYFLISSHSKKKF